ncbi:hypothetical protein WK58_24180 [Burkholderia ubonensis]|nr:hypothetical protein WK58_24180 [Burkholderia ubonensis]
MNIRFEVSKHNRFLGIVEFIYQIRYRCRFLGKRGGFLLRQLDLLAWMLGRPVMRIVLIER